MINGIRLSTTRIVASLIATGFMISTAQAAEVTYNYFGTISAILNPDGTTGGAFVETGGPSIGDSFAGSFTINTDSAVQTGPNSFDFGTVFPTLTVAGGTVDLKSKTALSLYDNASGVSVVEGFRAGAMALMGFATVPNQLDVVTLYSDEVNFDSNSDTGFEIILFSFDETATGISGVSLLGPPPLLNNAFFLFHEQIDSERVAAAFGVASTSVVVTPVPLPASLGLMGFGLAGLALIRRKSGN